MTDESPTAYELLAAYIDACRRRGLTITETIKAVRAEFGIGLGQAKRLVAAHPAYRDIHEAALPLHDEIIRVLDEE